jgi:hypothetical protein
MDFDGVTKEYATWEITMPPSYDGSTLLPIFHWFTATGDATKGVRWGFQCVGLADGTARNTALGTAQEVTDGVNATANVNLISAATPAITPGGSAAGGNEMRFVAYRLPTHGDDDLAGDARLLRIIVTWGTDSYSDE